VIITPTHAGLHRLRRNGWLIDPTCWTYGALISCPLQRRLDGLLIICPVSRLRILVGLPHLPRATVANLTLIRGRLCVLPLFSHPRRLIERPCRARRDLEASITTQNGHCFVFTTSCPDSNNWMTGSIFSGIIIGLVLRQAYVLQ